MPRDERGYWRPDKDIGLPNPWFSWPPKPRAALLWLKEYLWPYNILFMIVAVVTWALPDARDVADDRIPRRLDAWKSSFATKSC